MTLPNFIILGASKSGTSATYEFLKQHEQIYVCPMKETNFFAFYGQKPEFRGPRWDMHKKNIVWTLKRYHEQFDGVTNEIAIGEASPSYLFVSGTAIRIKQLIPDVKLIAILRNPTERAFSSFLMLKRDGLEPCKTLADAIADEPRRIHENWFQHTHIHRGYYGKQLEEYYSRFNQNQIHVCLYDDFIQKPLEIIQSIYRFIGVDDSFVPDMSKHHNISGIIKNPILRFLWTKTHPVRRMIWPRPSKKLRTRISAFFRNLEMERPELPAETRQQLINIYRNDILKLQDIIQRDLSIWLK